MAGGILDEAYERLAGTGPEWGSQRLSNHGPMAAEVLVRRGQADRVHAWLDSYLARLDELPAPRDAITDDTWPAALGDGRRIGDWAAYLDAKAAELPWRELLATWWPRLLPGIVAGATHGVIRVGHAVRALLAGDHGSAATTELARGLAFWAARVQRLPDAGRLAGRLDPAGALRGVPRIPDQRGPLAARLAQLAELPAWPASISSMRPAATAAQVPTTLQDLVTAATLTYPDYAQASPVLLVHAATAPNAVLHTLHALPQEYWPFSLSAAWVASAAIIAAYAPRTPAQPTPRTADQGPQPATGAEVLARAVAHGDEHVIKFADTAVEVYQRTGDPDALRAAARAADLIGR